MSKSQKQTKPASKLEEVLDGVAQTMLAELKASQSIAHKGAAGTVREAVVMKEYLSRYLPRTVEAVHSGELLNWQGNTSKQCDVMIVDPVTPPLYLADNYRIVPAECCHGVLEVKTTLDLPTLEEAWENIAAAKRVQMEAFNGSFSILNGMIFAYKSKVKLETLGERFAELARNSDQLVDGLWVLDRGSVCWIDPERHVPQFQTNDNFGIGVLQQPSPAAVLMSMNLHMARAFSKPIQVPYHLELYWSGLLGFYIAKHLPTSADNANQQ